MTGCSRPAIGHNAVRRGPLRRLMRTTIWHLRRISASGIWGDDYAYRTLWDEVCHEVQEGPFDMPAADFLPTLSTAFDMTIRPFVEGCSKSCRARKPCC